MSGVGEEVRGAVLVVRVVRSKASGGESVVTRAFRKRGRRGAR